MTLFAAKNSSYLLPPIESVTGFAVRAFNIPTRTQHPDLAVAIPSDAIEALLAAHRIVLPNHDPARSLRWCNARRRQRGTDRRPSDRRAPLSRSAPALASAGRNVHSPTHHGDVRAGAQPRGAAARLLLRVLVVTTGQASCRYRSRPRLSADLLWGPD